MHAPYPGQLVITHDDRGPIANLGAWLAMCCMILCVTSKVLTKGVCIGRLQKDDLYICLTMLFACAQVVTVSLQVKFGLGRSMSGVVDMMQLQHATMASDVFYIITLGFTQLSILQYIAFLSRDSRHRLSARCLSVVVVLWTVASFLSILFRCQLSAMGSVFGGQCFDRVRFWTVWTVMGGIIDTAIGLIPVFLLWRVPIRRSVKATVLIAFAARILALPVAIVRLIYIHRTRRPTIDLSYSMLDVVLLTTIHMNASIILTCIPFLKPVFDGLQSGILGGELRSNSLSHALSTLTSSLGGRSSKHPPASMKERRPSGATMRKASKAGVYAAGRRESGRGSNESSVGGQMVIEQTTTITVQRDVGRVEEREEEDRRSGATDWMPLQGTTMMPGGGHGLV